MSVPHISLWWLISLSYRVKSYWWANNEICELSCRFSSVQSLSHVQLFATAWTTARQASLSISNSQNLPKLMSIESVMPFSHLILCHPLLLPPSIFSQHQGLFKWVSSSHHVGKKLEIAKCGPDNLAVRIELHQRKI